MKKSFTLIELLIVLIIIGIITALALPAYNRLREKTIAAEAIQILGAELRKRLMTGEFQVDSGYAPGAPVYAFETKYWKFQYGTTDFFPGATYCYVWAYRKDGPYVNAFIGIYSHTAGTSGVKFYGSHPDTPGGPTNPYP